MMAYIIWKNPLNSQSTLMDSDNNYHQFANETCLYSYVSPSISLCSRSKTSIII